MNQLLTQFEQDFSQQFLALPSAPATQQPDNVERNEYNEPLCTGSFDCETKFNLELKADIHGMATLTENEQHLLMANVCCCGKFKND